MFGGAPFERGFAPFRLAQVRRPEAVFALEDYLDRIEGIADQKTRDALKAKYEECKKEGLESAKGLACLAALAVEIGNALKEKPEAAPALPPPAPRPAEGGFPVLPVAIGGLLAAGLVVFLATR